MHLGDGAITAECALIAAGAAAVGLGVAAVAARSAPPSPRKLLLAGGLGSLIFAAQAVNLPILPVSSAHLVGGVLLAWALGPGLAVWTMAAVLLLQAALLGDGGFHALGANVLNMALLPAAMLAGWRRFSNQPQVGPAQAAVIAALAIPLAALLIVGETALLRGAAELGPWPDFARRMLAVHLWIGALEGVATFGLIHALVRMGAAKPTSIGNENAAWRPALLMFAAAIVLPILAYPISSRLPDGLEWAAESSGLKILDAAPRE